MRWITARVVRCSFTHKKHLLWFNIRGTSEASDWFPLVSVWTADSPGHAAPPLWRPSPHRFDPCSRFRCRWERADCREAGDEADVYIRVAMIHPSFASTLRSVQGFVACQSPWKCFTHVCDWKHICNRNAFSSSVWAQSGHVKPQTASAVMTTATQTHAVKVHVYASVYGIL